MQKNISKSKQFLWNAIGSGFGSFITTFFVIIVTRLNGIIEAGIISLCFSITGVLFTVANLGNRTREVADNENADEAYLLIKRRMSVIAFCFSLLYCILRKYSIDKMLLVGLFMAYRIVEAMSDSCHAIFQKNDRLDKVGKSLLLRNGILIGVLVVMDIVTGELTRSVFFAMLAATIFFFAYDVIGAKKMGLNPGKIKEADTKNITKLVLGVISFSFITSLLAQLPRLIGDYKLSEAELGYLSIIMMLPSIMSMFAQFLIQPSVLSLTNNYSSGEITLANKTLFKITALLVLICAAGIGVVYTFGIPVLNFIFKLDFSEYKTEFSLALVAGLFSSLMLMVSTSMTIIKRVKEQIYIYAGTTVLAAVALFVFMKSGDITTSFVLYSTVQVAGFIAFLYYYKKSIRVLKNL